MLAPALLVLYAIEAVAALAMFEALRLAGLLWSLALGAVLVAAIGWRALLVFGLFWLAEVRPVPAMVWIRESWAFMTSYLHMAADPLRRALALQTLNDGSTSVGARVVLIHGWCCNGSVWRPMLRALRAAGVTAPVVVRLAPVLGDIDRMVDRLAEDLEHELPASDEPICLVAHSMGGLVARRYLQRYGTARKVVGLLTIASPHHGSRLARWGIGRAAKQMRTDGIWLRSLPEPDMEISTLCIWSPVDNLVLPAESARLDGRAALRISGCGHFDLLRDPRAMRAVKRFVHQCGACAVAGNARPSVQRQVSSQHG